MHFMHFNNNTVIMDHDITCMYLLVILPMFPRHKDECQRHLLQMTSTLQVGVN